MSETIDLVQAKIESSAGKFLQIKEDLNKLSRSSLLTVRDRAKELLVENRAIHNQIFSLLPKLKEMKETGSIDTITLLNATALAADITKHTQNVNVLKKEGGKESTTIWTTTNMVAAATVGILLLLVFARRR